MKTAIVYSTKHGATEKIAGLIAAKLTDQNVKLFDLKVTPNPPIENFDLIIIGGSIYYGKIQTRIKKFCKDYSELLLKKKIALYISCLTKEQEQIEFDNAYPETLRKVSIANGLLGGELIYDKLSFLDKLAITFIGKTSSDVHEINYEAIDKFVNTLQSENAMKPISCAV